MKTYTLILEDSPTGLVARVSCGGKTLVFGGYPKWEAPDFIKDIQKHFQ